MSASLKRETNMYSMDSTWKFVFQRLDNLEAELAELQEGDVAGMSRTCRRANRSSG
jgi:hypothetical protein